MTPALALRSYSWKQLDPLPSRSAALGHGPSGSETCRRAHVESLRAELLGPKPSTSKGGAERVWRLFTK
jgi:hypothetical protein